MKKGYKYFFSPQPTAQKKNEYIDHFYATLSKRAHVVNYRKKAISISADYLRYSMQADVMILNWPEDILHLRFGIIQFLISFIVLTFFKLKGGKIVWICHNKESHNKQYKWLRIITRSFFTRISNAIIVLSKDAISHFLKIKHKVYFLNHPVYQNPELINQNTTDAPTDVLIWGNISPYKGLNEFIDSYRKHKNTFGVKIIGHADKKYLEIIKLKAKDLNIDITDKFLSPDELIYFFKRSKIILFTYGDRDTFSSGALIHSLSSNKIIIGPAIGNFLDLNQSGACFVYEDFTNLFIIIERLLEDQNYYEFELTKARKGIRSYYDLNSWEQFIDRFLQIINNNAQHTSINKKIPGAVNQFN